MSDEQDKLKLSLEPPKLFGRKKKQEPAEPTAPSELDESEHPARPSKAETADRASKKEAAAKKAAAVESPAAAEQDAAEGSTTVIETVEPARSDAAPAPADPAHAELASVIEDVAVAESGPEPAPAPASEVVPEPQVVHEPELDPESGATTAVLPAVEEDRSAPAKKASGKKASAKKTRPAEKAAPAATTVPAGTGAGAKKPVEPVVVEPEPVAGAELEDAEIAAQLERKRGPLLTLYRAAAVTGLTVGVALVVLTWLSLRGCEAVRGTSSCGGGPGFLLLVATFAISVLLGSALLKAFLVPDPGSSSFLAVGLVAVVALLFLIDVLDSWVMLIVIPLLAIGAYLASVWVTKTFVEPAADT